MFWGAIVCASRQGWRSRGICNAGRRPHGPKKNVVQRLRRPVDGSWMRHVLLLAMSVLGLLAFAVLLVLTNAVVLATTLIILAMLGLGVYWVVPRAK